MATSSFDKDFTLKTKREVNSFIDIFENSENNKLKVDRSLTSPEKTKEGVEKFKAHFKKRYSLH